MHRETVNGHPWLSEDNGNGLVLIDLAGKNRNDCLQNNSNSLIYIQQ